MVFVSMYVVLLLKVDVSDERVGSQRLFEAILFSAHACMIAVIVVETVVLTFSVQAEQRHEPAMPWFRRDSECSQVSDTLEDDNHFSAHVYNANVVTLA